MILKIILLVVSSFISSLEQPKVEETEVIEDVVIEVETPTDVVEVTEVTTEVVTEITTEEITEETIEIQHNENELELLAKVVFLEAGNQDEMGKRLVIDCVLNRVNDSRFPNTITEVLYAHLQFEPSVYLAADYSVVPEIYDLVLEELESITNTEVIYFRNSYYHDWGTPVMQHQDHYFSK